MNQIFILKIFWDEVYNYIIEGNDEEGKKTCYNGKIAKWRKYFHEGPQKLVIYMMKNAYVGIGCTCLVF